MRIKRDTAPALVIMAAGLGSRFVGGIKQLNPVGPNGEIIMEYSVHDAIEAGFRKIVLIIRKDMETEFEKVIGRKLKAVCEPSGVEIQYAFQELTDLPEGFAVPQGREKPWGTCHAILSCRDILNEPFAIINADDYYGKEAYRNLYQFLTTVNPVSADFCMAGFVLERTLSDYGGVTRGICKMDENRYLREIRETKEVHKTGSGVMAGNIPVEPGALVSMNMWGVTPVFMDLLKDGFQAFLSSLEDDALTAEFLLPTFMGQLLQEQKATIKVLKTSDQWFGITYREDGPAVREAFCQLHEAGMYRDPLFEDLK